MATRKHESATDNHLKERLQEEFLSCKICFEPLKKPKALPCLHSFCLHCLKGYVRRNPANQPGYFNCPMCRKGTRVPPGGVDEFQDNFLLLSLADTIQEQHDDCSCGSSSGCSVGGLSSCSGSSNSTHYWDPPPDHHLFDSNTIGSGRSSHSNGSSGGGGGGSISRSNSNSSSFHHLRRHPQRHLHHQHSSSSRRSRSSSRHRNHPHHHHSSLLHTDEYDDDDDDDEDDDDDDDNNSRNFDEGSSSGFNTSTKQQHQQHQPHSHHLHHQLQQQEQQQSLHTVLPPPKCLCPPSPRELRNRKNEWYFGKVSRNASEEWLLAPDYPKGTFLIRHGEMSPDTYTLSVRDCDELRGYVVKHYKILTRRNPDTLKECYFIIKSRVFPSLQELVKHYQESVDGLCCKLVSTCTKPRSLIWSMERGKDDEYRMSRDTVLNHMVKPLGSGQFACVWLAKYQGSTEVAVKIQNSNCVTTAAFLDEAQILKTLQHPNIIELRGVCCEQEPVYLLLEYMPKGQLSKYLREVGTSLEVSQLVYIGAQIADAMAYMEKERFVHRNLGARNILVGENDRVKVAGFGMTKAVDDPDFNFRRGLKMAIKWMAPEVLLCNKYSTKADVWSFGVVLMEIFSLGKEPYQDKTSKEAFESVKDGFRMEKPDLCPTAVYDVMLMCWLRNAPSRPTFDFLNTFLHDFQS